MRYDKKRRVEMAKQGLAIAITNDAGEILDGSCPIATRDDLADAIQNFGRLRNKSAVKAHITNRAEALGALELLPTGWASKAGSKRRGRPVGSVSLGEAVSSDRAPRKRGRPPGSVSLTAEKANEIILLLRGGASPRSAAQHSGIPLRTLQEWIARGEGRSQKSATPKLKAFAKDVRKAQAEAKASAEVRVHERQPATWLRTEAADPCGSLDAAEDDVPNPERIRELGVRRLSPQPCHGWLDEDRRASPAEGEDQPTRR